MKTSSPAAKPGPATDPQPAAETVNKPGMMGDLLTEAVDTLHSFASEKYAMDAKEKQCNKQLAEAAAIGPITDPRVIVKMGDAPSLLSLIMARRAHIESGLKTNHASLDNLYHRAVAAWNGQISEKRDKMMADFHTAALPAFNHDPRRVQRQIGHITPSGVDFLNRAVWHKFFPQSADVEEFIHEVRCFLRHAKRWAKTHDLPLDLPLD